jgi:hypothetical protein
MKTLIALLIAAVLFPACALSQEKLPSREEMLKTIESFAKNPRSAEARGAASTIMDFCEKSPDVRITISRKIVPWLSGKPKFNESILLAAYVAGNVKSQLDRQTYTNDSYAGLQQVLKTYAQLKETDKTLDMPDVQKLVDLEAKNQLKNYVDEALKEGKKDPAK